MGRAVFASLAGEKSALRRASTKHNAEMRAVGHLIFCAAVGDDGTVVFAADNGTGEEHYMYMWQPG